MSIKLMKYILFFLLALTFISANADASFFTREIPYTRATGDVIDTGVINDVPVGFQTWKNSYAQTSIKYGATNDAGMWLWGATTGVLENLNDNNIQAIEGSRAYIYIREINQEVTIGEGGSFRLAPQVDTDPLTGMKQGHFIWVYTSNEGYIIEVEFKLRSVRNHLQWKYEIRNNCGSQLNISLRVLENVKFWINNGAVVRSSEKPFVLPTGDLINTESELTSIPSGWNVVYPDNAGFYQPNPYWSLSQDFSQSINEKNIIKPDRLIFGDMTRLVSNTWLNNNQTAKTITPGVILGTDSGVGLYFNSKLINPNYSRVYCGNLSMGNETSAVSKDSEGTMNYNSISIKNIGDITSSTNLIPLSVTIANASSLFDSIVSLSIIPGKGLDIQSGTNSTISNISISKESQTTVAYTSGLNYTWNLKPNGLACGLVPVVFNYTFSSGITSKMTFYLNIPASTTMNFKTGLYLAGFPYQFSNPSVSAVLGSSIPVAKYNNSLKQHIKSTDQDFSLSPGVGYWMKINSDVSISLQGAVKLNETVDYPVSLTQGWNLISSPFIYGVRLGDCKINYAGYSYSFKNAILNGYINPAIYSFNTENNAYELKYYTEDDLYNLSIQPFTGYWVYSYYVLNINFTGINNYRNSTLVNKNFEGWLTNLKVSTDTGVISSATFGVSSSSGLIRNVIAPPVAPDSAEILINSLNDKLSRQISYPSSKSVWDFTINPAPEKGLLTLRWGNQTDFPGNYSLTLLDKESGKRVNMRTNSLYCYNPDASSRNFEIIAEKRNVRLAIINTTVNVSKNRNKSAVSVNYELSAPANVAMNIRSITGKNISTVTSTADNTTGTLTWTGYDSTGKLTPAGFYLVELTAQDAEGTKVKSNIPVNIK